MVQESHCGGLLSFKITGEASSIAEKTKMLVGRATNPSELSEMIAGTKEQ